MKKTIIPIILLKLLIGQTFGQIDSVPSYKNLETKKAI